MCNNPLLYNTTTFPDSVFSGSGDSSNKYSNARISKDGWCSSGTGYLLLNLKKEYHITQVVVMADKEQTKWSGSYILKYSNDTTYKKTIQVRAFLRIVFLEGGVFCVSDSVKVIYAWLEGSSLGLGQCSDW